MAIFDRLHAEGQTLIIVTHEDHIARHCKRVIKLRDGQIVSDTGDGRAVVSPQAEKDEAATS